MILQKEIKNLNDGEKLKFVKNLLESFGIKTKLKRTGDVNMRIDAIGQLPKNKTAIFSIEFGNDSLSLPRNILENFAILLSKPILFSIGLRVFRRAATRFGQPPDPRAPCAIGDSWKRAVCIGAPFSPSGAAPGASPSGSRA